MSIQVLIQNAGSSKFVLDSYMKCFCEYAFSEYTKIKNNNNNILEIYYNTIVKNLHLKYEYPSVKKDYNKNDICEVTFELYYMLSKAPFTKYEFLKGMFIPICDQVFQIKR